MNNNNQQYVLVEKTSKSLKLQMLLSSILIWCSFILACYEASQNHIDNAKTSLIVFIVAIIWRLIVKVNVWWKHD